MVGVGSVVGIGFYGDGLRFWIGQGEKGFWI